MIYNLGCIYTYGKETIDLAIYGFNIAPISRVRGESVAKAAAYILRANIADPYLGMTHYYAYGKDLLYSEIIIPDYAPRDYLDLTTLLSAIENAEKRYDARTGRTVRLTIPNDREFSDKERIDLTRSFVKNAFVSLGMCAIMALHDGENGNPAWNNPHAHVLLTDRPVDSNGFCSKKNRNWNTVEQLNKWRAAWAEAQNRAFKEKGLEMRVSHESLEVQGIDREPTVPLGRAATALERKGIQTEVGNRNREIEARIKGREEDIHLRRQKRRERGHDRGR